MKLIRHKALITIILLVLFIAANSITAGASVKSFQKGTDGIMLTLDNGLMKVKICKDNIVEVKFTILPAFPAKTSLVINNE